MAEISIYRKLRNVGVFLGFLWLLGCNNADNSWLSYKIIWNCNQRPDSLIVMRDLVSEKWDKMCVFGSNASYETIKSVSGVGYIGDEFTRKILFILKDEVVYSVEENQNFEGLDVNQVIYDFPTDTSYYACYSRDSAIFKGEKKDFEGTTYYQLTPIGKKPKKYLHEL